MNNKTKGEATIKTERGWSAPVGLSEAYHFEYYVL